MHSLAVPTVEALRGNAFPDATAGSLVTHP